MIKDYCDPQFRMLMKVFSKKLENFTEKIKASPNTEDREKIVKSV